MWSSLKRAVSGRGRARAANDGASGGGKGAAGVAGGTGAVGSEAWNPTGWWWCMDHGRPENPPDAPGHRRLGPYDSAEQATNWRQRLDNRNEQWDEEDRQWSAGPDR